MKKRVDDAELAGKKPPSEEARLQCFVREWRQHLLLGWNSGWVYFFFRSFIQLMIAVSYHVFYETSARVIFWLGEGFCVVFKLKLFTTRKIKNIFFGRLFLFVCHPFNKHVYNFVFNISLFFFRILGSKILLQYIQEKCTHKCALNTSTVQHLYLATLFKMRTT